MSSTTPAATADEIVKYGWTAVPRDASVVLGGKPYLHEPRPMGVDDVPFPWEDPLVAKVHQYVKEQLDEPTYNHSMRVIYFGYCILQHQFPEEAKTLSISTWAIACLLHDIGTTSSNLRSTLLSFEYYGGILAFELLKKHQAPLAQAEAVTEAIIRHADIGTVGSLSFLGQLIQLGTLYDNISDRPELVHAQTRDAIVAKFPRLGWSKCFSSAMTQEVTLKPWAHTTALGVDKFLSDVEENKLMIPYEDAEK